MPTFSTILVPTDLTPASRESLACAAGLAKQFNGRLLLAHFVRSAEGTAASRKDLEDLAAAQPVPCEVVTEAADPVRGTLALASRANVDLIAMATRGRVGIARAVLGSVSEAVVRQAPCPVIVVRGESSPPRRILAPTDFSAMSIAAVEYAAALAGAYEARLELLHVVEDSQLAPSVLGRAEEAGPEEEAEVLRLHEELRAIGEGLGVPCGAVVTFGTPRGAIPEVAFEHGVDLIVLSTHGRTGLARLFLGSTAESVVRTAHCSVLTLRRPGPGGVVEAAEAESVATS